jgi:hypothetical protein
MLRKIAPFVICAVRSESIKADLASIVILRKRWREFNESLGGMLFCRSATKSRNFHLLPLASAFRTCKSSTDKCGSCDSKSIVVNINIARISIINPLSSGLNLSIFRSAGSEAFDHRLGSGFGSSAEDAVGAVSSCLLQNFDVLRARRIRDA